MAEKPFGVQSFPFDNSKLAEIEFYLVANLECDSTVFHPYRTLTALCKKESANESMAEAGEVGAEVDGGPHYWSTRKGQLELSDDALQLAWWGIPLFVLFVSCVSKRCLKTTRGSTINDTYRSDLCLLCPPHLLAITTLYLNLVLHGPARDLVLQRSSPNIPNDAHTTPLRRSSRQAFTSSVESKKLQDIFGFFAGPCIGRP